LNFIEFTKPGNLKYNIQKGGVFPGVPEYFIHISPFFITFTQNLTGQPDETIFS